MKDAKQLIMRFECAFHRYHDFEEVLLQLEIPFKPDPVRDDANFLRERKYR